MKAWRRPPGFFLPNVFAFEHDRKAFIDWSSPYAASGWLKRAVALANLGHFEQSSPRSRFESVLDEFRLDRTSCPESEVRILAAAPSLANFGFERTLEIHDSSVVSDLTFAMEARGKTDANAKSTTPAAPHR